MQSTNRFNRTMGAGILAALCLAAFSCAKPTPPEKIIEEYYRTLLAGDADGAYAQLSQVERQQVSAEDYRVHLAPMFDFSEIMANAEERMPSWHAFMQENLLRVEVLSRTETEDDVEDAVEIEVNLKLIDYFTMGMDISRVAPETNEEDITDEDMDEAIKKALKELYAEEDPPYHSLHKTFRVVRENGDWKVTAYHLTEINQQRAETLGRDAWNAEFDGDIHRAIELYREVKSLDPENETAEKALVKLEGILARWEQEAAREVDPAVAENIVLSDIRYKDDVWPTMVLTFENKGAEKFTLAEFRVVYYDDSGRIIGIDQPTYDFGGYWMKPGGKMTGLELMLDRAPEKWDGQNYTVDVMSVTE